MARWLLFLRRDPTDPLMPRQFNRAAHAAAAAAGSDKPLFMYSLRHGLATHLLERKVDMVTSEKTDTRR